MIIGRNFLHPELGFSINFDFSAFSGLLYHLAFDFIYEFQFVLCLFSFVEVISPTGTEHRKIFQAFCW